MTEKSNHWLFVDPYAGEGGAGLVQDSLKRVLGEVVGPGRLEALELEGWRGASERLRELRRSSSQIDCALGRASLVVLQSPFDPATISIARRARKHGLPWIVLTHGDTVPTREIFFGVRRPLLKRALWILLARRLLARSRLVVTNSELEKCRLLRVGARAENLCVIPNPWTEGAAPQQDHEDDTSSRLWKARRPIVLWLGRFSREKGLELLQEAWREIVESHPEALLVLAGSLTDSREERRLRAWRDRGRLGESVLFHGHASGVQKTRLLAEARCVLLPSWFESFGMTVPEAVAAGTPVIASTGTPWEGLQDVLGRWLPREPRLWAEAIRHYLTLSRKVVIPPARREQFLAPYRVGPVADAWRSVLRERLLEGEHPWPGGARSAGGCSRRRAGREIEPLDEVQSEGCESH